MSKEHTEKWQRRPWDFKLRAIERMRQGERATTLARELGVSRSLLYYWKQHAVEDREITSGVENETLRRLQNLERKIAEIERHLRPAGLREFSRRGSPEPGPEKR